MAGGVKLAGEHSSGATVHGSMNREHWEREGKQANTSGPIRRSEDAAGKVAAMAEGQGTP